MQAIRFIIMAVALPKGHFLAASHGRAGQGERYDQILAFAYPDNSLSRWERHAQPASYYPKRKPGWRKCRSGGVYYKLRRGTTNQTCLRFAV